MEVVTAEPSYSVVNVSDLGKHATVGSEAEAMQMQATLIKKDPSLKGRLQVMSHIELSNN